MASSSRSRTLQLGQALHSNLNSRFSRRPSSSFFFSSTLSFFNSSSTTVTNPESSSPRISNNFFFSQRHHHIRTMATSTSTTTAGKKIEWLVVVPDFEGVGEKRLEVRPDHFAGLGKNVDNGCFQMGGAVLSEPPTSDDPKTFKFAGSTIVLVAESREEVIKILKDDVYAQKGVWDVDNAQMWPFKCAFRFPVPGQQYEQKQ
ncbi:hypothetical protein GE21DRAFT_8368 [Neurospora crassa]|uniref:YCII-related domain-containing protein n=2 Tax=Neurospora crassa TaxID=5141 RepID=Q1K6L1_NEUCR|nr:hypothetical protein NCU08954 [Neurospora crassa OR74A]EAA31442.2 hypothetical protein NCU08954 [Neurospora crassa OR74A]KHE78441.1 hypothetical protein GE21DRAFT_8368 [Neurospora crassa]|eukprot:XP_960678.2 hypothetical protein NCU08954 [Neurospora crassa OR74A]